ncbi:hypothetical protein GPALN_010395 [Globodera pallida]|nr:hypothetical protein GPALN_010395 [Globodera pallida]
MNELSTKQRLLEAIYDKVPEDRLNLNGHFSMDEYKYLKTRHNQILHNDPALSQVLQSLINAETSAKLEMKFDVEHQQNVASSSGLGNNSATQNDAMVEIDQINEEQQQFDNNQSEIVELIKMSGMWRFLSLNIVLVKLLHAPISASDVNIDVPEDKKAEQFEKKIAGIGVLGTLSEAALGAFLSTWLPELTKNKCVQWKKMESCGKFGGTCVEENSGMVTNDDPCCMDGFEWQCCAKAILLMQKGGPKFP